MKNNYKSPVLIYNPVAAGGSGRKIFENYHKILTDMGLFNKIDVYESYSKDNAIAKVQEVHRQHVNDLIITIGGDGSISTVCNGIMKMPINERLPILPLPSGTGNSLLRDFNIKNVHDSIDRYINDEPKIFDVIHVEEINGKFQWYCVNVLGFGFVSEIASFVSRTGKKLGAMSYPIGTVLALGNFRPYKTIIKYNKGKDTFQSDRVYFMTLSNTKYTGGKIMIAPDAKYDDGLIDVIILYELNRFGFLNGFRKVFKGNHIHDKGCLYFKTTDLEIHSTPDYLMMPDGELEGHSPVRVKIIPKQIKFIV